MGTTDHLHTMSALPRLSATSIIVETNLTVHLCQWPVGTTDELDVMARLSLPLQPHPASAGSFLTAAHYARLYRLMKSVKAAHQAGRVNLDSYTLYAEYFNAITEIAEAIHGADLLDVEVAHYQPETKPNQRLTTTADTIKKPLRTPNLLDEQPDAINEPTAIYPDVITAIYNRQLNTATNQRYGYCVLSGDNFDIIPILDWLDNENAKHNCPIMPYSDPFDTVEEH